MSRVIGAIIPVLLVLAVLSAPVKFSLSYKNAGKQKNLALRVSLWGIYLYRFQDRPVPPAQVWRGYRKIVAKYNFSLLKRFLPALIYLLKHTRIEKFTVRITLGLDSAAGTAIAAGSLWALAGGLAPVGKRLFHAKSVKPHIEITPDFGCPCFLFLSDCIFEVRFVYIILTGLKVLYQVVKQVWAKKAREAKLCPNTQLRT